MGVELTNTADAQDSALESETDDLLPDEGNGDLDQEGTDSEAEGDEDEVLVTFGDEAAPASNEGQDSGLVRKLRAEIRDRDARLAELAKPSAPQVVEVGEKPTLESCDYDEDTFETALDAWKDRKRQAEEATTQAQRDAQANQAAWAEEMADFGRKKLALKVRDFEAAEEEVVAGLSQTQQAIVIKASSDAAKVIYALGKHPAKLATLAAIQDPIKFAVAVSKLEGTLKVTTGNRTAPAPEGIVRGSAPISRQTDKHLQRLEAEAERTGDRTEVVRYKRQIKVQAK
jgi:hypothetical protein